MQKQWSLFVKWDRAKDPEPGVVLPSSPHLLEGYCHFWWNGVVGYEIDYTSDHHQTGQFRADFPGTETYSGFVDWAFQCANELPGREFIQAPGCPECGSVQNAQASQCLGMWHEDNQPSPTHLKNYMNLHFPEAVKMADGDGVLAALNVLNTTQNVVSVMWPIVVKQAQAVINGLRAGGIPIPGDEK